MCKRRNEYSHEARSQTVSVSPVVAITGMLCLLVLGLVIVIRADPPDLPKIARLWGKWFRS